MKADITLGSSPGSASVKLDGVELASGTSGLVIKGMAGAVPVLELNLLLTEARVSVEGALIINAHPISEEIGRAIYESLKQRYEDKEAQQ